MVVQEYCECGCGGETRPKRRFIVGHNQRKNPGPKPGVPRYLVTDEGCWEWQWATDRRGYGRVRHGDRTRFAHQVEYEKRNGDIPEGLELDHLCRNPPCVNPDHLEPVTHAENVRRGEHAGKLTSAEREQVCDLIRFGMRYVDIAAAYGITKGRVGHIKRDHCSDPSENG